MNEQQQGYEADLSVVKSIFGGYFNIEAKIIADSATGHGHRITTFQLKYPRFIHSELMTHRMFSRNAMSSRAVPVKRILAQVWHEPAHPIHWGENRPGMQANEQLTGWRLWLGKKLWRAAGKVACAFAWGLDKLGAHKQWANRILEPWQFMHTIVTATEYDNFYDLRKHKDAQPEFQALAYCMDWAHRRSTPTLRGESQSLADNWHLPYVTQDDRESMHLHDMLVKSAAACARVSYNNHDGSKSTLAKDTELYNRLVGSHPQHASPIEHQAMPAKEDTAYYNLKGWMSQRYMLDKGVSLATISDIPVLKETKQ